MTTDKPTAEELANKIEELLKHSLESKDWQLMVSVLRSQAATIRERDAEIERLKLIESIYENEVAWRGQKNNDHIADLTAVREQLRVAEAGRDEAVKQWRSDLTKLQNAAAIGIKGQADLAAAQVEIETWKNAARMAQENFDTLRSRKSQADRMTTDINRLTSKELIRLSAELREARAQFAYERNSYDATIRERDAEIADLKKLDGRDMGCRRLSIGDDCGCQLCETERKLAAARAEMDHWKANHDEIVARNHLLRDRTDLTADQIAEREGWRARVVKADRDLAHLPALLTLVERLATAADLRSRLTKEEREIILQISQRGPDKEERAAIAPILADALLRLLNEEQTCQPAALIEHSRIVEQQLDRLRAELETPK